MTVGGHDNRGPSIAELQRYIRNGTAMEFVLSNGDVVVGKLRWFDEQAFSVVPTGEEPFTILRSAVLGYRPHAQGAKSASVNTAAQAGSQIAAAPEKNSSHSPSEMASSQDKSAQPAAGGQAAGDDMEAQLRGIEELEKAQGKD